MPALLALWVAAPYVLREEVRGLVWTKRGALLAITAGKVVELPSRRSYPLRRYGGWIDDPIRRPSYRLLLNASRTQAIGNGFVLDLRTLASKPLRRAAAWDGDRRVEIEPVALGRYRMRRGGHSVPLAPGWFVLGVSEDLRLALACRKEPFDGDTTCLLSLRPETGQAVVVAIYPRTSDDHGGLSFVARGGSQGRTLLNFDDLALEATTASFLGASKLRPIKPPVPASLIPVSSYAEWTDRKAPWILLRRRIMRDLPQGFDADTLDLWNPRTGATVRVAKAVDDWTEKEGSRGDGPSLGAYAVDWPSRRIAYIIASPKAQRVFVRSLPL